MCHKGQSGPGCCLLCIEPTDSQAHLFLLFSLEKSFRNGVFNMLHLQADYNYSFVVDCI